MNTMRIAKIGAAAALSGLYGLGAVRAYQESKTKENNPPNYPYVAAGTAAAVIGTVWFLTLA